MKTETICVLFGGRSSEHEISCLSAAYIISVLRRLPEFQLSLIGITEEGFFEFSGSDEEIADGSWERKPEKLCPLAFQPGRSGYLRLCPEGRTEFQAVDVFFPVLHGRNGEDGRLQGLFESLPARCVGCQTLASALTMDKDAARRIFAEAGLAQTPWLTLNGSSIRQSGDVLRRIQEKHLKWPLFVKPANAGSSVGISKVHTPEELPEALELAFREDEKILIEEGVEGRELECAVLETDSAAGSLLVSPPGEIIPGKEFYDYEDKYDSDSVSQLRIPAPLPDEQILAIRELAAQAFRAADCRGLARVDFFIRAADGALLLNEINTMPGFTSISMYPKLMELAGVGPETLMRALISCT